MSLQIFTETAQFIFFLHSSTLYCKFKTPEEREILFYLRCLLINLEGYHHFLMPVVTP